MQPSSTRCDRKALGEPSAPAEALPWLRTQHAAALCAHDVNAAVDGRRRLGVGSESNTNRLQHAPTLRRYLHTQATPPRAR